MKYLPIGLLSAYIIKCGIIAPSIQDAIVILALAAIQISLNIIEYKRLPEIRQELTDALKQVETTKQELRNEMQSLRSQLSASNLAAIKKTDSTKFRF